MAQPNSSVKVVEVCKVAPQPSSPDVSATPPPESLPLTLFDLPWLRFAPVERLFLYQVSHSAADILIPKLKFSLSIVLQQFPPLAGNITWPQHSPKPILSYVQGDAVSLTIAEYSNTNDAADHFHHLSSIHGFIEAGEYHPLVPQLSITHEKAAAMAIQVTIFPNRGFSIGTSMHHAVMDGKSSTLFIKSWAHICKHFDHIQSPTCSLPEQLKPFFDRNSIQDVAGLESLFSNQLLNINGPNNRSLATIQYGPMPPPDAIRGTFVFTRTKIESLKQLLKDKSQLQVHPSTFSITFAYAWVCLVKAMQMQEGTAALGLSVDCRPRLDPPVPENYFGNCVSGRVIFVERKELLGENGLTVAVKLISEVIKSFQSGAVFVGTEHWIPLFYAAGNEKTIGTAGSPRFRIYDTDFGWGRPKKVEVVSIERTGAISLAESKEDDGGGVEVGLVLRKHEMQIFADLFAQGLASL